MFKVEKGRGKAALEQRSSRSTSAIYYEIISPLYIFINIMNLNDTVIVLLSYLTIKLIYQITMVNF